MDDLTLVLFGVLVLGLFMLFSGARAREQARISGRLAAIERKLDAVMKHLGIAEPRGEHQPDVVRHLEQGNKIQAIKAYREQTGVGLAEAKHEVERIARERML
ncbi:ribosomal protein L7/L12 [Actinoplanes sp. NBC_00393]|uniref:ribosomal protein L7/L12 n=1 Tax=Actinoplanes sp. NBC_00393 TaxID=2975953 RepID=UPI002E1BCCF8